MKMILLMWTALLAGVCICAQEPASPTAAPTGTPAPARPAVPTKAEPYLLLPEPKEMRVGHSVTLGGAKFTVFNPVHRLAGKPGLEPYSKAEFAKLGISPETFADRARLAADRLLAGLQPELIKDDSGRVRYAVYRGDDQVYACLLAAPSLAKVFQNIFGSEVWVASPDRHALYVFPPNPVVVDDFAGDLQDRFETDAFAASEEVFIIRGDTGEMRAVGTFTNR